MRAVLLFAAFLLTAGCATLPADAHRRRHHLVIEQEAAPGAPRGDPRPRAWCGWQMRQELGVADISYNLARNWAHYGTDAGGPHVGALIVWPHHVGRIVAGECPAGEVMLHSGNDLNQLRTRCFPWRGAIAFRNPG